MGNFLLSHFSPESLSWIGFVGLIVALVGEAAVYVVSKRWKTFHSEAAFAFAILAAGAFAVERIGDDAIIHTLEAARDELKEITSPRTITDDQRAKFISCLKAAPERGPIFIRPGLLDSDAQQIGSALEKIFDEIGGFEKKQWPEGPALSWTSPGIFIVVTDIHHTPSHATAIQRCFWQSGRKVFGYADPKHPPDAVSIGIGPRL